VLLYGFSSKEAKPASEIISFDDLDIHSWPLASPDSFNGFDAVAVFAGSFEKLVQPTHAGPRLRCEAEGDLDRRNREFWTLFTDSKPFIFLVSDMHEYSPLSGPEHSSDLFRRILHNCGIDWRPLGTAHPVFDVSASEFSSYIKHHGTARVMFRLGDDRPELSSIAGDRKACEAFEIQRRAFFLPCHRPETREVALGIVADAARAVLAYRKRLSTAMPAWVSTFSFAREKQLTDEFNRLRTEISSIETQLGTYEKYKGALCLKSDPLVEVVAELLTSVLGLRVPREDKKIEDLRLIDDRGTLLAVIEVKGETGSFKREHISQTDTHRERLELPPTTPGLLIMNTMMKASSLPEKDVPPHHEIIKKALSDKVLLVRTLDLLRYADLVERGIRSKEDFRSDILGNVGWLRVENDAVSIVTA
jgi:hypothetical protein